MKTLLKSSIAAAALLLTGHVFATVVVTTTSDGSILGYEILGSGVGISNLTYIGAAGQAGTYTGGLSAGIGIESGIIMTSGDANLAAGPNTDDGTTGNFGTAGDADLNGLITQTTYDANVLEFDFDTDTGDLFFDYVFASEEYNEYVDSSYNDVFAFFVDGVNIALAPDNATAVSINNVNCGNPFGSADNFCSSYNNNDLDDGGPYFDIEYDGFTDVFTASVLGLTAGQHHMKIAIADAGDTVLDSAVFIESGSFSSTTPIPEPSTLALMSMGIIGLRFSRKRKKI